MTSTPTTARCTPFVGVDLDVRDNEFFALLGPSGCGKTTLLRSVAGFEHPTSGSIRLAGADLLALPAHRRPVNMMFQSYALFPHMSVERNIAYGPARAGAGKQEVASRGRRGRRDGGADVAWRDGVRASCPAASASGSPSPAPS